MAMRTRPSVVRPVGVADGGRRSETRPWWRVNVALVVASVCAVMSGAEAKTTKYTYDALGRLTYVEDSQNGNRDYDYDKMGNRLKVSVGTASDAGSEPTSQIPVIPTGLSKSLIASCAWRATWNLSPGATSYSFKNTQNQITTIYPVSSTGVVLDGTNNTLSMTMSCPPQNPQSNQPYTVKACNASGCSAAASF